MFTGLIEEVGSVVSMEASTKPLLCIEAPKIAAASAVGDSIAINGSCLTIVKIANSQIDCDLLEETMRCTNLWELCPGDPVNCEASLVVGDRFGGHLVQGHVDTTAQVVSTSFVRNDFRLEVAIPSGFSQYLISKGSVALNGVSLTVAELKEHSFVVWIIPHTLGKTNLGSLQAGKHVNLEFDVLAKYVERMSNVEHTSSLSY